MKLTIAFDVDDTLIIPSIVSGTGENVPNYEVIAILKWFQLQGNRIVVWSGSGIDWATRWAEKLGLSGVDVAVKGSIPVDIAFDDCDVELGNVNVKVNRIENSVSRTEWNKTKS